MLEINQRMNIFQITKDLVTGFVDAMKADWWLEVTTTSPHCTYYFGPFLQEDEARNATDGYLHDLESEGAEGITVAVKRCTPAHMTIKHKVT